MIHVSIAAMAGGFNADWFSMIRAEAWHVYDGDLAARLYYSVVHRQLRIASGGVCRAPVTPSFLCAAGSQQRFLLHHDGAFGWVIGVISWAWLRSLLLASNIATGRRGRFFA